MGAGESKEPGDGDSPRSLSFSEDSLPTLQRAWEKEVCAALLTCNVLNLPLTDGCASAVQRHDLAQLPAKWADLTQGCCAPRTKDGAPPGQTPQDSRWAFHLPSNPAPSSRRGLRKSEIMLARARAH